MVPNSEAGTSSKPWMECLVSRVISPDCSFAFMKSEENDLVAKTDAVNRDILKAYVDFIAAEMSL